MIQEQGEKLMISGVLNMYTVPAIYRQGLKYVRSRPVTFDFSQAEAADSAAVSMLLGWKRAADASGNAVKLLSLPDDVDSLATLYDVTEMLPQRVTE